MLYSARARCGVKLTSGEARATLNVLRREGWCTVGLQSELVAGELLGVSESEVVKATLRPRGDTATDGTGDVIVHERRLYYFIAVNSDERSSRFMTFAIDEDSPSEGADYVETGVVAADEESLEECYKTFQEAVVEAIRRSVDGRRFRHLSFDWERVPDSGAAKLAALCERLGKEGAKVRFDTPSLDEEVEKGAAVLVDPAKREILRDLSSSGGFALESDIARNRGDEARGVVADLTRAGLASASHLVQCRQSSRPLTRISESTAFSEGPAGQLRCATCNRLFREELLVPGYDITDLGRRLIRGSHWMTVWVTQQLVTLGAPADGILWNLEETSEEIDIVMAFLGEVWILELKDRDFDQRDAHSLNYRRVRYQPEKTFVITSGSVSSDARRVFEDVAREAAERRRNSFLGSGPRTDESVMPKYIEGLSAVAAGLKQEFERAARALVGRSVAPAALSAGLHPARLSAALQTWQ